MATQKTSRPADPSEDLGVRIREAAYYHWERRGRPHGTAMEDWLCAESMILAASGAAQPRGGALAVEGAAPGTSRELTGAAERAQAAGAPVKPKRKAIPKVKKSSAA